GGIVASSSGTGSLTLTVVDSLLKSNTTDYYGRAGGIIANSYDASVFTLNVVDSTFRGNRAHYAGAIYPESSDDSTMDLNLTKSLVVANVGTDGTGAIALDGIGTNEVAVSIDGCVFKANRGNNPSDYGGTSGAIDVGSLARLTVTNSVFLSNQGRSGAVGI